jgi:Mrp family chromosome partitioning ATPase
MLETLKQGDARRIVTAGEKPADTVVQDCVVDWEIGAEVPFVEVGGPNRKIELSPGLLQHPPQIKPQPPHHVLEAAPLASKPKAVQLTAMPPMKVAYEAWPGPAPNAISAEIIAFHQPEHLASQEYAKLLDAMLQPLAALKGGGKVLLLIGRKPHVGASTVLLNLAAIASQAKKLRVIAVDAKPGRAGLAPRLGQEATGGLIEVIEGTLALEAAILKTGLASLHLLPAGQKNAKVPGEAMAWLLAWLRGRYDLILMDGPTIEEPAELAVHVANAHGIYLVLPHGEPANAALPQIIGGLGGRLCGLIHTHFEM